MKPRDVKLSRRLAMDYLLIGIAMGGSREMVGKLIQPSEMLTDRGRLLLKATLDKDRKTIAAVFHERGFDVQSDESVCHAVIRNIKNSNADQSAMAVAEHMSEQMQSFLDLDDVIVQLEKATTALKQFQSHKETQ